MTLDKTNEFAMHAHPGSGCNRNTARVVFGEAMGDHGQAAVDQLIQDNGWAKWGVKSRTHFDNSFK